ncbi:dihydrofolate reductase family protein [Actinomadura roseirufa]|uniref:dihydrofolate reductase family protein n=1 Tax=Actinomadura roseirufa TaxID=2094049 RepID=UPI0010416684|nr:dihydrofolate reductase family protein [Actinomadura roseirufa]
MASDRPFTTAAFMATSLDGYIARADGDILWLTERAEEAWDASYTDFAADVDTLVMGRGTYEAVRTLKPWPFTNKRVVVLSTRLRLGTDPRITVHHDLDTLVKDLSDAARRRRRQRRPPMRVYGAAPAWTSSTPARSATLRCRFTVAAEIDARWPADRRNDGATLVVCPCPAC